MPVHTDHMPTAFPTTIVFGGTFDPPHRAHVLLPQEVMQTFGASEVLYVPAAIPPLKRTAPATSAAHRLAMLRLALAAFPESRITTEELDRAKDKQPSYTVDTLEALHTRNSARTWRLLIGTDQMHQFEQWRSWQRIAELAEPLVMLRAPLTRTAALAPLPSDAQRHIWAQRLVEVTPMEISSTTVRARLTRGDSVASMLDPEVEAYVRANGLYGVKRA